MRSPDTDARRRVVVYYTAREDGWVATLCSPDRLRALRDLSGRQLESAHVILDRHLCRGLPEQRTDDVVDPRERRPGG